MFDYFKLGENEQYVFLQLPLMLIKDEQFKGMSGDSKILYSLLLNRTTLSAKNNWVDDVGNIYIIYPIDQICEDLNCWEQKAIKAMKELKDIGLVKSVRRGLGKPNLLYVMNFATSFKYQKQPKAPIIPLNCENHNSRVVKTTIHELPESQFKNCENHNEVILTNNKNDLMEIESKSVSTSDSEYMREDVTNDSDPSTMEKKILFENETLKFIEADTPTIYDYEGTKQQIHKNIEYEFYTQHRHTELDLIDEVVEAMLDVICTNEPTVKISRENKSRQLVRTVYLNINSGDIEHILERYKEQCHKIKHLHSYLKTMLYTVKQEIGFYYTNLVRIDGVV